MAVLAGYNYTLQLYSVTEVLTGGNATINRQFIGNIKAAVAKNKLVENYGADRSNTNQLISFRVRYRIDITTNSIINYNGTDYSVDSIEPVGFKDVIIIYLKAVK